MRKVNTAAPKRTCVLTSGSLVQGGFLSTPQRAEGTSWHCPKKERRGGEVQTQRNRNRGERLLAWVSGLVMWTGGGRPFVLWYCFCCGQILLELMQKERRCSSKNWTISIIPPDKLGVLIILLNKIRLCLNFGGYCVEMLHTFRAFIDIHVDLAEGSAVNLYHVVKSNCAFLGFDLKTKY